MWISRGRKRIQKAQFLLRRPELWKHWDKDVWKNRKEWLRVVKEMKAAGLVAQSVGVQDVCIPQIVYLAREIEEQQSKVIPFQRSQVGKASGC